MSTFGSSESEQPSEPSGKNSVTLADKQRMMEELRMMFQYASGAGLDIDPDTGLLIASAMNDESGLSPRENELLAHLVRQLPIAATKDEPYSRGNSILRDTNQLSLVIAAHNALTKLIAPATPISLAATEPAPGWLGSIRRPPLVLTMIVVALIAIIGFVITSVVSPYTQKPNSTEKKAEVVYQRQEMAPILVASFVMVPDDDSPSLGAPPSAPAWQKQLNWCFAAALGAVFYVLFTVHEYVKNRTFDPRYNSLYVVRFVLGILSGLILANVISAARFNGNETLRSLGPAVAALLGGFSTEAVYQVLQRLVEIMLSAIRGDNSNTAKAQASDKARSDLLTIASDSSLPRGTVAKLQAAAKKVGK